MLLYAITDRRLFPSTEALIDRAASWARTGVDYVQIREKDLTPPDLAELAARIVSAVRSGNSCTRVLLNGPAEVAVAAGCDGVHLPANQADSAIHDAHNAMRAAVSDAVVSISCHTVAEIEHAREAGATLALFAPVFEKRTGSGVVPGQGLPALAIACSIAAPMPVFALGGVTAENAQSCVEAGAAGIAAIRLFAAADWGFG